MFDTEGREWKAINIILSRLHKPIFQKAEHHSSLTSLASPLFRRNRNLVMSGKKRLRSKMHFWAERLPRSANALHKIMSSVKRESEGRSYLRLFINWLYSHSLCPHFPGRQRLFSVLTQIFRLLFQAFKEGFSACWSLRLHTTEKTCSSPFWEGLFFLTLPSH